MNTQTKKTVAAELPTLTQPELQPTTVQWASIDCCEVDGYIDQIHVLPLNDLKPHTLHHECWCNPAEDDHTSDMWVHFALDNREWYFTHPFH